MKTWLSDKQYITNWTVNSGKIGEDFRAFYAGGNYIIVYPESATHVQRVPKDDFKVVYENWNITWQA